MSDDRVGSALGLLGRPVEPPAEFAEELFRRLVEEAERARRPEAPPPVRRPLRWPSRPRLALAGIALALAVALAASLTAVLGRPASALAVIREAQQAFADLPPFRATVAYDLNPEGYFGPQDTPKGATARIEVSYRGPTGFRADVLEMHPVLSGRGGPGSFIVWDGKRVGSFRADENSFFSGSPRAGFEPLRELSWNAPYPNWEDICRRGGSEVLPDEEIAGRSARHVRCGDWKGGFWELWIDRETGLILKLVGQVGEDDFRLGTSPRGGFEITSIEYGPAFSTETFRVAAPRGALNVAGEREAALRKVPPLRATYSVTMSREQVAAERPNYEGDDWVYVDMVWYRDESAWRLEVLEDSLPEMRGLGPGSFMVWDGEQFGVYDSLENTFSVTSDDGADNPVLRLSPWADAAYDEDQCEQVGESEIADRPARHLRCRFRTSDGAVDVWIDADTGLYLKVVAAGWRLAVTSIEYDPAFPPGTFEFVPPASARDVNELASDPYAQTDLVQGEVAPSWTAPLLGGGTLSLEDLRGKPALILLLADWCPLGDPACDVLPQFQQAFGASKDRVGFLWVNLQGTATGAEEIVQKGGYTFPVADDPAGEVGKAWGVEGIPTYVLLDPEGRVIEVRVKPQTLAQLNDLLAEAGE